MAAVGAIAIRVDVGHCAVFSWRYMEDGLCASPGCALIAPSMVAVLLFRANRLPVQAKGGVGALRMLRSSCAPASQDRPGFFDEHCASEDDDGCDDTDGFERVRVTLLEEPLGFLDCAKHRKHESDCQ